MKTKSNIKKTIYFYWQTALKYKLSFFLTVAGVICASVINIIVPLYFKEFFDALVGESSKDLIVKELISILIIIAGLEFLGWISWRTAGVANIYFQPKVMEDLTNKCFTCLHKHSFSFFNNNFVGSLVKRVKYFVNAFENIADKIMFDLIPFVVNIGLIIIILFNRNLFLGLIILIWVVVFLFINWLFARYKLKYDMQRSESQTKATGLLADTITNNVNVKLFNGYNREVNRFGKATGEIKRLQRLTWGMDEIFRTVQTMLMMALEIGIFYLAIQLWQKGILTIGDIVLLQAYLFSIFRHVWGFGRIIVQIYERLADAEEMTVILIAPYEIKDVRNATNLKVSKGKIEFKDVNFNYRKTRRILNKFNLVIKPGEKVALIGPSGAGKSTLVKLIVRMHNVDKGAVLIDNQIIAKITQESLWKNVSLVPQDPILFHRTLMENIRYGNSNASDKDVIKAAKAAHCHEFISSFPEGYDTYVGERGVKLSGGERQRVAIARAILKDSPILVLDEATSSLDSESEMLIQEALDKLMKHKTVIAIAHRLSTIRKMDKIIVIDRGEIIEQGSHEKLVKKSGGVYNKLWKLQASGFIK